MPKQEHYTNIQGEEIDDKYCEIMDVSEKDEYLFLKSLDNRSLELLSNIIYKMNKLENKACIDLVKAHSRFYTKSLDLIVEDLEERYTK